MLICFLSGCPISFGLANIEWKKMEELEVTICCLTYNHGPYLERTLAGFIEQVTDFKFEILICDDCSVDSTLKIAQAFRNEHPDKIRILTTPTNQGPHINYKRSLESCTGKYIAYCEGDDYWTDPNKLQKQVNFLKSNPDYFLCCHSSDVLFEDKIKEHGIKRPDAGRDTYDYIDLVEKGNFIGMLTIVYERKLNDLIGEWHMKCPIGDYSFYLAVAMLTKKKIKFFEESMSMYRVHSRGRFSSESLAGRVKMIVSTLLVMKEGLPVEFSNDLESAIYNNFTPILNYHEELISTNEWLKTQLKNHQAALEEKQSEIKKMLESITLLESRVISKKNLYLAIKNKFFRFKN